MTGVTHTQGPEVFIRFLTPSTPLDRSPFPSSATVSDGTQQFEGPYYNSNLVSASFFERCGGPLDTSLVLVERTHIRP